MLTSVKAYECYAVNFNKTNPMKIQGGGGEKGLGSPFLIFPLTPRG